MLQLGHAFESRGTIAWHEPHSPISTSSNPLNDTLHSGQLLESAGISA